jgi:hypothetical protein
MFQNFYINYVPSPSIKENLLNRSVKNSQIENAITQKADSIVKTKSSKPYPIAKEYILDEYDLRPKGDHRRGDNRTIYQTEQNRTSLHVYDLNCFPSITY